MFSLVITIIAIALVAALALATLYYGGDAFESGWADAQAARLITEGQQLLAASELYFLDNRKWPDSIGDLTAPGPTGDSYLKPMSPVYASLGVQESLAQVALNWEMPAPGKPIFKLSPLQSKDVCKGVNRRTLPADGILSKARVQLSAQCYGESFASLNVLVHKGASPADLAAALGADKVTEDAVPSDTGAPDWLLPPGVTVVGNPPSGGGGGGGTASPTSPFETYVCSGTYVLSTAGGEYPRPSIIGPNAGTKFVGSSATFRGDPLMVNFYPNNNTGDQMDMVFTSPAGTPTENAPLVISAPDGTAVTCTFQVGAQAAQPTFTDFTLPEGLGTWEGNQTVKVGAVGGTFSTDPAYKPKVLLNDVQVPSNVVNVLSPTELTFVTLPPSLMPQANPFQQAYLCVSAFDGTSSVCKWLDYEQSLNTSLVAFSTNGGRCEYFNNYSQARMQIEVASNDWSYYMIRTSGVTFDFTSTDGNINDLYGPFSPSTQRSNMTESSNSAWQMGGTQAGAYSIFYSSAANKTFLQVDFYDVGPNFFQESANYPMELSVTDPQGRYGTSTIRLYCDYNTPPSTSYADRNGTIRLTSATGAVLY